MENNLYIKTSGDLPEEIDNLMDIVHIKSWIILFAIGFIAISFLFWSIFGKVPKKVHMEGILIKEGGIGTISHIENGQITDIKVSVGDIVSQGECIGTISIPELVDEILLEKNNLEKLKSTPDISKLLILEKQKFIKELQNELKYKSSIIAPYNGKIIEITKKRGNIIAKGTPIISMEIDSATYKDLIAVFYIKASETNGIKVGSKVSISPASINKEEHGYLLGNIISISEYPVTKKSMLQMLGNDELVNKFSTGGLPVEIKVDLLPDPTNLTGYKWSTKKSPTHKLQSGIILDSSVTIAEESPINIILHSNSGGH